jgi:hypothetical protein
MMHVLAYTVLETVISGLNYMSFANADLRSLSPTSVDLSMEANDIEIFKWKPVVRTASDSINQKWLWLIIYIYIYIYIQINRQINIIRSIWGFWQNCGLNSGPNACEVALYGLSHASTPSPSFLYVNTDNRNLVGLSLISQTNVSCWACHVGTYTKYANIKKYNRWSYNQEKHSSWMKIQLSY